MNLARDVKGNWLGMRKDEILNVAFASVFTIKTRLWKSQGPENSVRKEDVPLVAEDQVREYLRKLDIT